MFDVFKKFMKQYNQDPAAAALKKATKQSSEVKFASSDDEDKAVDYALGLYKQQHKDNGTFNPYPWL